MGMSRKSQLYDPFQSMSPENQTIDNFNHGILASTNWGVEEGPIKGTKVINKPKQAHPSIKYSPLSPRKSNERTFLNRLKVKSYANRLTDSDRIKREWNKSVLN
jgi:hypothetical protein